MKTPQFFMRPVDPEHDFERMAQLFSSFETEPTTPKGLGEWYARELEKGMQIQAAAAPGGDVAGFFCLYRRGDPALQDYNLYLIVAPEFRRQGLGRRLYTEMETCAAAIGAARLFPTVRDDDPASLRFAVQRGYKERAHAIEMLLDLAHLDLSPYDAVITGLTGQGFRFASMAELGDTADQRRKLYDLNSSTAATTPGSEGEAPWPTFDDFQKSVCETSWYRPEGQIIAIEESSGVWAAMSAITRFEGADHAYNLFTGVRLEYRGRKLGQAVKALALRYAAEHLGVTQVRTTHHVLNAPMIAIDRKLGYVQTPGMVGLVKEVN